MPGVKLFMVDGTAGPTRASKTPGPRFPTTPIADESAGAAMLYSSGTTGRPKGVKRAADRRTRSRSTRRIALAMLGQALYGWTPDTVYLSPGAALSRRPAGLVDGRAGAGRHGDHDGAVRPRDWRSRYIEQYQVTSAQWVPTHFVRMLKLPAEVRASYDVSSLTALFHAAAPCPVPVKEQMIAWWGPIIHEYYAGTEGNGFTAIDPEEWLAQQGLGRPRPDRPGEDLRRGGQRAAAPRGGPVYFAGGGEFEYHNDPEKTAESRNQHGWTTLGDVGWLDEDGYLFLTDRKSFMIISGGVNIYPQEIENLLIAHPKVADVAVVGAPHEEMGEQVVAVIQPADWADAGDELAAELTAFARANLSHVRRRGASTSCRSCPATPPASSTSA